MSTEIETVLNLLESFRGKSHVQSFLEGKDVPHSGTWEKVRERIRAGTKAGSLELDGLIQLLEEIEEHGDQYVFLYDLTEKKGETLPSIEVMKKALTQHERKTVLDTVQIIEEPSEKLTLVSALFEGEIAKLKWVQRRSFHRQVGETIKGNRLTIEYEIVPTRAIDLALIDLKRKRVYLCVQRVEPGIKDAGRYLQELKQQMRRFLDPDLLTPVDLRKLMQKLSDKTFTEVRRRRHQVRDSTGSVVDAISATEDEDIFSGGLYNVARDNYVGALTDLHSNVYWISDGARLDREIHTLFPYRNFSNAVVFTQRCLKSERDYVLSRIEEIARG